MRVYYKIDQQGYFHFYHECKKSNYVLYSIYNEKDKCWFDECNFKLPFILVSPDTFNYKFVVATNAGLEVYRARPVLTKEKLEYFDF